MMTKSPSSTKSKNFPPKLSKQSKTDVQSLKTPTASATAVPPTNTYISMNKNLQTTPIRLGDEKSVYSHQDLAEMPEQTQRQILALKKQEDRLPLEENYWRKRQRIITLSIIGLVVAVVWMFLGGVVLTVGMRDLSTRLKIPDIIPVTPNLECVRKFGPCYIRTPHPVNCQQLYCFKPSLRRKHENALSVDIPDVRKATPEDGMICGQDAYCIEGECVQSNLTIEPHDYVDGRCFQEYGLPFGITDQCPQDCADPKTPEFALQIRAFYCHAPGQGLGGCSKPTALFQTCYCGTCGDLKDYKASPDDAGMPKTQGLNGELCKDYLELQGRGRGNGSYRRVYDEGLGGCAMYCEGDQIDGSEHEHRKSLIPTVDFIPCQVAIGEKNYTGFCFDKKCILDINMFLAVSKGCPYDLTLSRAKNHMVKEECKA